MIFECSKGKRIREATSLGLLGGARLQKQLDWWTVWKMVGWAVRSFMAQPVGGILEA